MRGLSLRLLLCSIFARQPLPDFSHLENRCPAASARREGVREAMTLLCEMLISVSAIGGKRLYLRSYEGGSGATLRPFGGRGDEVLDRAERVEHDLRQQQPIQPV